MNTGVSERRIRNNKLKRRRELRHHFMICILTFVITLWDYACQYGEAKYYDSCDDYIKEVISINSLTEDKITAGQHLILPYYSSQFVS